MFDILNKVCPEFSYTDENKPRGGIFMIQDSWVQSGLFVVLEMMKSYLKQKEKIVVMNVMSSYSQVVGLLRKQGLNIEQSLRQGQLLLWQVDEASQGWLQAEVPMTEQRPQGYHDLHPKINKIEQMFKDIQKVIETGEVKSVIIDNLYYLANLLPEPQYLLQSVRGLQELGEEYKVNVVVLMTYDPHCDWQVLLFNKLQEQAHYLIKCLPLASGYSQEAHGQVHFSIQNTSAPIHAKFLFSLTDHGLNLFDSYQV